jgi:hypothetical protein
MTVARRGNALVAVAVVAAAAACTGGGSAASRGKPATGAVVAGPGAFVSQTKQRVVMATAYAELLTRSGPRLPGETTLTPVPTKLKQPDQTIGANNLITRARYWSVAGSPMHVYAGLKRAPVAHLRLSGFGPVGAGSSDYAQLAYIGTDFPSYLDDAELYVEIVGAGGGRSDVAAFAEVVPVPVRAANEVIPTTGTVVIARTRLRGLGLPPLRQVTLTPAQAAELVAAVNRAPLRPGDCIGGLGPSFGYRVTVTTRADVWTLAWSGLNNCDSLTVYRGGRLLTEVQTTPALLHLLQTDLLGADGSIDGAFWEVKGGSLLPLEGTVTLAAHGHVVATFAVDRQSGYEFIVPPGVYTLTGRSPRFKAGAVTCGGQHPAVVVVGGLTTDDVRC